MVSDGGLDLGLRKWIGIQIVQADWLSTRLSGHTDDKSTGVAAGIVLKFEVSLVNVTVPNEHQ